MRLVVSTTDQGVRAAGRSRRSTRSGRPATACALAVPEVGGRTQGDAGSSRWWVLLGVLAALGLLGWAVAELWGRRRRRRVSAVEPDGEDVPLRFEGVTKAYKDGFVAVRDLSFEVRRGQVLGLLGPERRGQDDVPADAHGPDPADRGADQHLRARRRARRARAVPARLVRRGHRAAAAPVRPRQPDPVLGGDRPPARGRAHGRGDRGRRPRARRSTSGCAATARACGSGSRSPRRCSACPTCWCSTSRPTGWTRRRSTRCARCCGPTPRPAAR